MTIRDDTNCRGHVWNRVGGSRKEYHLTCYFCGAWAIKRRGTDVRFLGALLLAILFALPAAAQPWVPPARSVVRLIDLAGRTVSTARIDLARDPWNGKRWPDCGAPDSDLWERRYAGSRDLFTAGLNFIGFQNENAHLGARAVSKFFTGDPNWRTTGYQPWCFEVGDWNATHARTCAAYRLTFADGCGSETGDGGAGPDELPDRLVEYCRRWGWTAPGHPAAVAVPACRAYRGCDRTPCGCYEERASGAPGGAWVSFDPTRPECRPDRSTEPEPEPEPEPPVGWAVELPAEFMIARPGLWEYQSLRVETSRPSDVRVWLRGWDPGIEWSDSAQVVLFRLGRRGEVACEIVYRPRKPGLGPRLAITGCGGEDRVLSQGEVLQVDAAFELTAGSWTLETGIDRPVEGWPAATGLLYALAFESVEHLPEPPQPPPIDLCGVALEDLKQAVDLVGRLCRAGE